nr:glycerol-3-phosphate responsive antiterminator [Pantoea sp. 1.19]
MQQTKPAAKLAFIPADLLEGSSNQEAVIPFLKIVTGTDGIISTKPAMLKAARQQAFCVI